MIYNYTTWKVAELFFTEPSKEHYLKDISRKISLSHTSIIPVLKFLLKEEIIERKVNQMGKRAFPVYYAKKESEKFRFFKKISNLINLEESGTIDLINKEAMPNSIILFGSYSRGEDLENSDIDLFVQSSEKKIDLSSFEKLLNRKINLYFAKTFDEVPKELKNNILNGAILSGFIEVFK